MFADCGKKSKVPYESFKGSVIPLRTEWTIDFGKGEAVPSPVLTANLASWTELGDSLHCYYSGTGTYRTTFDLPVGLEKATRIRLKFSEVREMAKIFINGIYLEKRGIDWRSECKILLPTELSAWIDIKCHGKNAILLTLNVVHLIRLDGNLNLQG